jgi:hypothetical protein
VTGWLLYHVHWPLGSLHARAWMPRGKQQVNRQGVVTLWQRALVDKQKVCMCGSLPTYRVLSDGGLCPKGAVSRFHRLIQLTSGMMSHRGQTPCAYAGLIQPHTLTQVMSSGRCTLLGSRSLSASCQASASSSSSLHVVGAPQWLPEAGSGEGLFLGLSPDASSIAILIAGMRGSDASMRRQECAGTVLPSLQRRTRSGC